MRMTVCQSSSYDADHGEFAHTNAVMVAATSTNPPGRLDVEEPHQRLRGPRQLAVAVDEAGPHARQAGR